MKRVETKLLSMVSKQTQEHMKDKFEEKLITRQVEVGSTLQSYAKVVEELLFCHFDQKIAYQIPKK